MTGINIYIRYQMLKRKEKLILVLILLGREICGWGVRERLLSGGAEVASTGDDWKIGSCQMGEGCAVCDDNGVCEQCIDDFLTTINEHGLCECRSESLSFDSAGYCVRCWAHACKVCQHQEQSVNFVFDCHECLDPQANLINGECRCGEDEVMVDGMCQACPTQLVEGKCEKCEVEGCAVCEDGNSCDKCIDYATADLIEGKCQCQTGLSLNSDGLCSICNIFGCRVCQRDSNMYNEKCYQCLDETATIVDGECTCEGGTMDDEGYCVYCNEVCNVHGCSCCQNGQPDKCAFCIHEYYAQIDEQEGCSCRDDDHSLDSEGYCVQCRVNGCQICLHQNIDYPWENYLCHQCTDPTATLLDGKCICPQHQLMVEGLCEDCPTALVGGKCQPCPIVGCAVCSDGSTCEKCIDTAWAIISNGQCECSSYWEAFNVDEICEECFRKEECICEAGNTDCAICFDQAAVIVGGECVCPGGMKHPVEKHCLFCDDECDVVGCQCCQEGDPNTCLLCQDESGTTIQEGQCVCQMQGQKPSSDTYCWRCSVSGCASCLLYEPQKCYQCEKGFYLQEYLCQECLPGCEVCTEPDVCSKCFQPKVLRQNSCHECSTGEYVEQNNCYPCTIEHCVECSSATQCTLCSDQMLFEGGECRLCPIGQVYFQSACHLCQISSCYECETPTSCQNCLSGTVKNEEGLCEECPTGFMEEGGECVNCGVIGCEVCSSVGVCSTCLDERASITVGGHQCLCEEPFITTESGYCFEEPSAPSDTTDPGLFTTESGQQVECPTGCHQCSSLDDCTSCLSAFFQEGGKCIACHTSCLTCKGATASHCLSCPSGFHLSGNACSQCPGQNCLQCSSAQVCQKCVDKFVVHEGECQRCPEKCQQCSSPTECIQCDFGLVVSSDGSCQECLSGCSKCSSTDIRVCEDCPVGSYLQEGQCLQCQESCLECDSSSNCLRCAGGFKLANGDCAYQCTRPCLTCSFENQQQKCSECLAGYFIENKQCKPDFSCNQQQECEACPFGAVLVEGICQNCSVADQNCRHCSAEDLTQCSSCQKGYFLGDSHCGRCPESCEECQSEHFCVSCSQGFFSLLDGEAHTGRCAACQHPCRECDQTASRCTTCIDGYSKEGWKCISDTQVIFTLLIDTELSRFVDKIAQFKEFFLNITKTSSESLTLTLIQSGSVKIQGNVQTESEEQGRTIFQNLNSDLQEGKSIMGFSILKSEIEKKNIEGDDNEDEQDDEDDKDDNKDGNNDQNSEKSEDALSLGAIIGISVGVLVLVVIGTIVICNLNKQKYTERQTKGEFFDNKEKIGSKKTIRTKKSASTQNLNRDYI